MTKNVERRSAGLTCDALPARVRTSRSASSDCRGLICSGHRDTYGVSRSKFLLTTLTLDLLKQRCQLIKRRGRWFWLFWGGAMVAATPIALSGMALLGMPFVHISLKVHRAPMWDCRGSGIAISVIVIALVRPLVPPLDGDAYYALFVMGSRLLPDQPPCWTSGR